MNQLIKTTALLSAIAGGVFGILLLIPVINLFACLLLFTLVGAGLIYFLKKNALVGGLSIQSGAILGAVSGFISLIAASIVFIPLSYIINLIISLFNKTGFTMISSFLVAGYSLFVIMMLVFFIAMLSALFNAFTGMVVTYIFERLENTPKDEEITEFTIE